MRTNVCKVFYFLFNIAFFFLSLINIIYLFAIFGLINSVINLYGYKDNYFIYIIEFFISIVIFYFVTDLFKKTIFQSWIPAFFYTRLYLGVPLKADEALRVSFLFDGSLGGKWFPVLGVRDLDKKLRRAFLFQFANRMSSNQGWGYPFPELEEQVRRYEEAQGGGARARGSDEAPIKPSMNSELKSALAIFGFEEMPEDFEHVKKAYREKMAKFHPDKISEESPEIASHYEEIAKKINQSYSVLKNFAVKK